MTPLDLLTIFLPDMLGTVVGIVAGLYLHRLQKTEELRGWTLGSGGD